MIDYEPELSEVLRWIIGNTSCESFPEAERLLRRGYAIGAIIFLGRLKLWEGTGLFYCQAKDKRKATV